LHSDYNYNPPEAIFNRKKAVLGDNQPTYSEIPVADASHLIYTVCGAGGMKEFGLDISSIVTHFAFALIRARESVEASAKEPHLQDGLYSGSYCCRAFEASRLLHNRR
jgi:hypothetical protein